MRFEAANLELELENNAVGKLRFIGKVALLSIAVERQALFNGEIVL